MKKTFLGVVAITMLLVAILATTVNAATLTADKEKMKKGDIVTVKVQTKNPVESMQFILNFDADKYEFVENSISSDDVNMLGKGALMVLVYGEPRSELTLQFKAIENGKGIPFTIAEPEFSNDEAMENATIYTTVAEPEVEKPTPEEPNKDPEGTDNKGEETEGKEEEKQEPTQNENTEKTEEKYINDEGKVITKIPQTGSNMPVVIGSLVVLGIVFIAGYKMIKNK